MLEVDIKNLIKIESNALKQIYNLTRLQENTLTGICSHLNQFFLNYYTSDTNQTQSSPNNT